ncbi:hypothetical protein [Corynebacterium halotolerans]|uniref:Uncharacterized protein n=1 Tax=Corynebacterium halotolerans YIM 70093 = DSM 44683 TaxID=1121362 RepID=M1NWR9_9CORY|nr:hypothetical protein [Corynebacterium halotolerans]AGF71935.1 hypothetical protein A605_04635 [Corynebacterium halotolerans YIM 70093 = DSM 44683]
MGFFGRFRGSGKQPLPADLIPAEVATVELDHLAAHTAESIVAVTLAVEAVEEVRARIRERSAFALRGGGTTVIFLPVDNALSPAFDPATGWLVPVTSAVAGEIDRVLRPVVGAYELAGTNLGFIVETAAA